MRPKYEMIVLPSGPDNSLDRLNIAVESWLKSGGRPYFLVSGGDQYERLSEQAKYYGVPESRLRIDRHASSTKDNVMGAKKIAEELGVKSIYFATSYYQSKRLKRNIDEIMPDDWTVDFYYRKFYPTDLYEYKFFVGRFLSEFGATMLSEFIGHEDESTYDYDAPPRFNVRKLALGKLESLLMRLFNSE